HPHAPARQARRGRRHRRDPARRAAGGAAGGGAHDSEAGGDRAGGDDDEPNPNPGEPLMPDAPEERMLKWFAYEHLPTHLSWVSKPFGDFAAWIASGIQPGPERTVALRKLLEAKDAAVRAKLHPGG